MLKKIINRIVEAASAPEPISLPALPPPAVPTFREYAIAWLEKRRPSIHPGTHADYGSQLRDHLTPRWGDVRLDEIRTLAIRAWVDEIRANPKLSNRTVRNLYGLLRNVMSEAQADELIVGNPCCLKGSHLPENTHRDPHFGERHVFTRDELLRIIDHPSIPIRWRALYTLLFASGVRIGEALALAWADVELDSAVPLLRVSKSYNSKVDYLGLTKTKVSKKIPIHPRLEDEIYRWWSEYLPTTGEPPEGDRLVFPAVRGGSTRKHMRSSVVYHRFVQQLTALGMDRRRVHDARRTFVTLASNTDGVVIETIKKVTHPSPGDVHGSYRETPPAVLHREIIKLDLGKGEPSE